ncbi:MAG: anaerobic ribonucleoside-triphosphate reductase [Desulfobacteraceae bacterium]|jgi:hypothetical protein|nr:anaerobic ribonucleoside-triphosphate reductase [Desulfobacteraceae bacterium]
MTTMTAERLHDLFDEHQDKEVLAWPGVCHDCNCDVKVTATPQPDGIYINGGSVFEPETGRFVLKCDTCYSRDPVLRNYQSCEVYSRVVGYLRPVGQWNDAKSAEFKDRKTFDTSIHS